MVSIEKQPHWLFYNTSAYKMESRYNSFSATMINLEVISGTTGSDRQPLYEGFCYSSNMEQHYIDYFLDLLCYLNDQIHPAISFQEVRTDN